MKRHTLRATAIVATTLAIASFAAACNSGSASDSGPSSVTVGLLQPMTGSLSAYGEESTAGFTFIVDAYNALGGVKSIGGAKIKVVVADSAGDPTKAGTEAKRLVSLEKVNAIAGILSTPEAAASTPFLEKSKIPSLGILSAYKSDSKYSYTLGQTSEGYAKTMVDFVGYLNTQGAGIKSAGLTSSNYELGQQVDKQLEKKFADAGIDVVESTPLDITSSDYTSSITKMNNKHPDVVAGAMTLPNGLSVFKARMATNASALWIGTSQIPDQEVWNSLGDTPQRAAIGVRTFQMTNYSPDAKQPSLQALIAAVQKKDPKTAVTQNFVMGAQAAWVLIDALERAKSTDGDELARALSKTDIPADSERMVLAREHGIEFGEDGFMTDLTGVVTQLTADGTQHVVWPEAVASQKVTLP